MTNPPKPVVTQSAVGPNLKGDAADDGAGLDVDVGGRDLDDWRGEAREESPACSGWGSKIRRPASWVKRDR